MRHQRVLWLGFFLVLAGPLSVGCNDGVTGDGDGDGDGDVIGGDGDGDIIGGDGDGDGDEVPAGELGGSAVWAACDQGASSRNVAGGYALLLAGIVLGLRRRRR